MLVFELALENEDLLATPMCMRLTACARRPAHQRDVLGMRRLAVERPDAKHLDQAGTSALWYEGVLEEPRAIAPRGLTQADQKGAAALGARGVAAAVRVHQKGCGRILAVLVGKHPVEHQDLPALGM